MRAKLKLQGPLTASRPLHSGLILLVVLSFCFLISYHSASLLIRNSNSKTAQLPEKLSWPSCSHMCRSVPKTCAFVLRLALWGPLIQIQCCQFESFSSGASSTSESNASCGGATTSSCVKSDHSTASGYCLLKHFSPLPIVSGNAN